MKKIFLIICIFWGLSLLINAGCSLTIGERHVAVQSPPPPPPAKPAPPPWAPAHGHRAKYHYYYYYPECQVYFDVGRRLYFYYQGGAWQVSAFLPSGIQIVAGEYVSLEMDVDRPYVHHHHVVKHYPPGHFKKHKDKGKGKKWD